MKIVEIDISESTQLIGADRVVPSNLNILIGANNSGKSLFLRELEANAKAETSKGFSVKDIKLSYTEHDLNEIIERCRIDPPKNNRRAQAGASFYGKGNNGQWIQNSQIESISNDLSGNENLRKQWFLKYCVETLDGKTRLTLAEPSPSVDMRSKPSSPIQRLQRDVDLRNDFRNHIRDILNVTAVIDPTEMQNLNYAISPTDDFNSNYENELGLEAISFFDSCQRLIEASDGTRAVFGIIAALLADEANIFLIDEPEAFLHPAVSERLGYSIGKIASDRNIQVYIATHSAPFLKGILHSEAKASVFRFSYRSKKGSVRVVSPEQIGEISGNSLIRSTKALNGVFYDFPIVVESDTDAAFYDEVQYLGALSEFDARVFLNARSKQTIPEILGPLRGLGSKAAAIVDLDLLHDQGVELRKWFDAVSIDDADREELRRKLTSIRNRLSEGGIKLKKTGVDGIYCQSLLSDIDDVRLKFQKKGIILVQQGELERLLPSISGKGPAWLKRAFEFIEAKEDPSVLDNSIDLLRSVFSWQEGFDYRGELH